MSLKSDLANALTERRRLKILQALAVAPVYMLDEVVLLGQLSAHGSPVAVGDLHSDLRHLRDHECIVLQTPGGVWMAELTRTGLDVSNGLAHADGVATPQPGA